MRKDLFDELVESVKQMKEIQAGRRKLSRDAYGHRTPPFSCSRIRV